MNFPAKPARLARAIERFLVHQRALGHGCRHEAWLLGSLCRHMEGQGRRDLDTLGFERWLTSPRDHHPNTRRKWHQMVCLFCRHRRRHEPRCFVPPAEWAPRWRPHVAPVIVEPGQVARMLALASKLAATSASPLCGPVLRLAVVLLYTCGLRLGELLRLALGDIEERGSVLRVRETKFHKSRLVPLSRSTAGELQAYLRRRNEVFAAGSSAPLLVNRHGGHPHAYAHPGLQGAINRLFASAEVRDEEGRRPRVHDLRHSFAVQALLRWYRRGADVQAGLPKLALYMGHASIVSSAWYLHWVPDLRRLASRRFEHRFGHLVRGGAR